MICVYITSIAALSVSWLNSPQFRRISALMLATRTFSVHGTNLVSSVIYRTASIAPSMLNVPSAVTYRSLSEEGDDDEDDDDDDEEEEPAASAAVDDAAAIL